MTGKTPASAAPCVICRKRPAVAEYRPFCSKRCADVDLQGWFSGRYALPGEAVRPADESFDDD